MKSNSLCGSHHARQENMKGNLKRETCSHQASLSQQLENNLGQPERKLSPQQRSHKSISICYHELDATKPLAL